MPETDRPVDEQRIIRPARRLADRQGGRVRELVRRADDELLERVMLVQPQTDRPRRGRPRRRLSRVLGNARVHVRVERERDLRVAAGHFGHGLVHDLEVVLRQPLLEEVVRHADVEFFGSERLRLEVPEPGRELLGADAFADGLEDVRPRVQRWRACPSVQSSVRPWPSTACGRRPNRRFVQAARASPGREARTRRFRRSMMQSLGAREGVINLPRAATSARRYVSCRLRRCQQKIREFSGPTTFAAACDGDFPAASGIMPAANGQASLRRTPLEGERKHASRERTGDH